MNINDFDIWCVDFETYYDDIFSLKHLDSLEYIADERFKVHMMGVAINDNEPFVLCANDLPAFLSQPRARPIALLCQNTQFDGMILSRHYGFHADAYLDTRAMAAGLWPHASSSLAAVAERLWPDAPNLRKGNELALSKGLRTLPEEVYDAVASYCLQDVRLTRAAFNTMRLHFPLQELDVIDIMTQWCVRPAFELDYDLMARYIPKLDSERRQLIAASNLWRFADKYNPDTKGRPQFVKEFVKELAKGTVRDDEREYWLSLKVLNSNKAFGQWFAQQKIPVPIKLSPDGRSIPAFAQNDPEFMAMAAKHPQYAPVWEARASAKSTQALSRANKFVRTAIAYNGRIPVPLRYGAAHTGRAGGSDGINLQNLQRNADKRHPDGDLRPGALRRALLAPPGYSVLVADLSNIEARMLAWLAGHDTLLEIFADGGDPYAWMASKIYNRPVSKDTDPFGRNVGKVALLSLGYGAGVERFTQMLHSGPMGLPPIHFDDKSMYQRIVATYRRDNSPVASLWNWGNVALTAMMQPNTSIEAKACRLEFERCVLPNGLSLQYPDLSSTFDGMQYTAKNAVKTKIYGAKFIENCIAENTLVLTRRGWVPIQNITKTDQVHDGIKFVNHSGLLHKGTRSTIIVDGVHMTPDHKVLTNEGWTKAIQAKRLHRPDIRLSHRAKANAIHWGQNAMAVFMQLWKHRRKSRSANSKTLEKRLRAILRMPKVQHHAQTQNARDVQTPGLLGVEINARQVPVANTPSLAKLRGSRNNRRQNLGSLVRSILERYERQLQAGVASRQNRQQQRVQQKQLPLGDSPAKHKEQTKLTPRRSRDLGQNHTDPSINTLLPLEARPVYDITNCGPRSRFVVLGTNGPFVVHNCTQALATCVIKEAMVRIEAALKPLGGRTVLQVHDEIVAICPEESAADAMATMLEAMIQRPTWCPDLPIAAEGGYAPNYSK